MAKLDFASSQAILPNATVRMKSGDKKQSNNHQRRSSSEYDDSSLEEFFSPARPATNNMAGVDSSTVDTSFDSNDAFDQIIGSITEEPLKNTESALATPVTNEFGQHDVSSQAESNLPSFEKENTQTRASYDKTLDYQPAKTSPKRNVGPLSDATGICNSFKRAKMKPSPDGDANINHGPLNDSHAQSIYQPESQDENIEALLLQEFGDIVNFSGI